MWAGITKWLPAFFLLIMAIIKNIGFSPLNTEAKFQGIVIGGPLRFHLVLLGLNEFRTQG